jgi:hypothetical protein
MLMNMLKTVTETIAGRQIENALAPAGLAAMRFSLGLSLSQRCDWLRIARGVPRSHRFGLLLMCAFAGAHPFGRMA